MVGACGFSIACKGLFVLEEIEEQRFTGSMFRHPGTKANSEFCKSAVAAFRPPVP